MPPYLLIVQGCTILVVLWNVEIYANAYLQHPDIVSACT